VDEKKQRGAARIKLTTDSVKKLATDNPNGQRTNDAELSGFGATVYPSGRVTFWCRYGPRNRRRFTTIGTWGEITVKQARTRAETLIAQARLGDDPVLEEQRLRSVPTFTGWVPTYLRQAQQEVKPSTYKQAKSALARAGEYFGATAVDELTRADIQDARLDIAERSGNVAANRWLSTVRTCLDEAMACGYLRGNPASGIKRLRENPPRQRVLDDLEMARLQRAIAAHPDPLVRCAFWMLIGTGARKGEVLGARWEHLNLDTGSWRIPDPKANKPQTVFLSDGVVEVLRETPRIEGSPWVIPSTRDPQKHKYDLQREWVALCETAAIEGAIIHDLRRTFGERIARQAGLHIASKLLRHSDIKITAAVYAPIDESTLRAALLADNEAVPFQVDGTEDLAPAY
jgi:integrase